MFTNSKYPTVKLNRMGVFSPATHDLDPSTSGAQSATQMSFANDYKARNHHSKLKCASQKSDDVQDQTEHV
jgi:hypothetical protein